MSSEKLCERKLRLNLLFETDDDKTEPTEGAVVEETEDSGDGISTKDDTSASSTSQDRPDTTGIPVIHVYILKTSAIALKFYLSESTC